MVKFHCHNSYITVVKTPITTTKNAVFIIVVKMLSYEFTTTMEIRCNRYLETVVVKTYDNGYNGFR